jgi:hypothetical protein
MAAPSCIAMSPALRPRVRRRAERIGELVQRLDANVISQAEAAICPHLRVGVGLQQPGELSTPSGNHAADGNRARGGCGPPSLSRRIGSSGGGVEASFRRLRQAPAQSARCLQIR